MAEQAEVLIKNVMYDSVLVVREQPNGSRDNFTLALGGEEVIFLASSDAKLFINTPSGVGSDAFPVKVKSDVGLGVTYSVSEPRWTIRTQPDGQSPPAPTTVNVSIGEEGPGN